ncbi:MAG: ATP phosphoribosyltransferase, partial [Lentisphaeria bacterium]|nr:ATP phosphoribosyltransferase [Lentisphaeria bacterium]
FSWGATEVKPPRFADAIVEITETGSSLKANNLVILDTLCISTTRFIANHKTMQDPEKKAKIEKIALLLKSVMDAHGKVGIKLNVRKENLEDVLKNLPALQNPTVSPLAEDGWYALDTIVDQAIVRDLIPELKKHNATGIVEYPLNKLVD